MKKFLLVVLGFVLGAVVTIFFSSTILTGIGAGVGVATGLKAGACLTVEAAKEKGFITSDQVEEVLRAAVKQIAQTDLEEEAALSGADAECEKVVSQLKSAGKN